jgi:hypothetical protein
VKWPWHTEIIELLQANANLGLIEDESKKQEESADYFKLNTESQRLFLLLPKNRYTRLTTDLIPFPPVKVTRWQTSNPTAVEKRVLSPPVRRRLSESSFISPKCPSLDYFFGFLVFR